MVGLAGFGFGDRLVFVPTGKKVEGGSARLEVLTIPSRDSAFGWMAFGVTPVIEVELLGENLDSEVLTLGTNVKYNLLLPITDIAPGLSFGMVDVGNDTADGRAAYVALTYFYGNVGALNQDVPTELTVGLWTRREGFFFAGARLPFSESVAGLVEHDSLRITAGIEVRPFPGVAFRGLFRGGSPAFGFQVQKRF